MEFQIEEVYEKRDFTGLIRAVQYQKNKVKRGRMLDKVLKAILGIWVVYAGLGGFVQLCMGYEEIVGNTGFAGAVSVVMPCVLLTACGAGLLISLVGKLTWRAEIAWKQYQDKGRTLTYRLSDMDVSCQIPGSDLTFEYSLIQNVLEDQERFYLFMDKQSAHILKKTAFTKGTIDDFRIFISKKSGQSIEYIK